MQIDARQARAAVAVFSAAGALMVGITSPAAARADEATSSAAEQLSSELAEQLKPSVDALTVAVELETKNYRQRVMLPAGGHLTVDWYARAWTGRGSARAPHQVLLAAGAALCSAPGSSWLSLRATAPGRSLIQHEPAITITATAEFQPDPTDPISASAIFRLS